MCRGETPVLLVDPQGTGQDVLLLLGEAGLRVRTSDYGEFTRRMPSVVRDAGIRLFELRPTDDSLESVFGYLVGR